MHNQCRIAYLQNAQEHAPQHGVAVERDGHAMFVATAVDVVAVDFGVQGKSHHGRHRLHHKWVPDLRTGARQMSQISEMFFVHQSVVIDRDRGGSHR